MIRRRFPARPHTDTRHGRGSWRATAHARPLPLRPAAAQAREGTAAGRSLLLKNSSGQKALQKWSNCHVYDHSQAAGRQYWTEMCLNMTDS